MGCTMCSQLMATWGVTLRRSTCQVTELTLLPEAVQGGYHRVTGLHYMSSFSDAEDCCDDSSSSGSLAVDRQGGAGD